MPTVVAQYLESVFGKSSELIPSNLETLTILGKRYAMDTVWHMFPVHMIDFKPIDLSYPFLIERILV